MKPRQMFTRQGLRLALPSVAVAVMVLAAGCASGDTSAHLQAGRPTALEVEPVAATIAPSNPLAGRPWGVYKGAADMAWPPYVAATGTNKSLLGKIALRPKAAWFGAWIPNKDIAARTRQYISNSQAGDPNALVQIAVFRMVPWEGAACTRLPTAAEQGSYKQWIDSMAGAIGTAHTAIILQPDGPFALCAPGKSLVPSNLIRYSAKKFSSLPHTSVYIDAGAADWPSSGQGGVPKALQIVVPAGVEYARGIALNSTHYSSTDSEVRRGAAIVQALAARGIRNKHVVINTSSSGHPFVFGSYTGPDPDNAWVCRSTTDNRTCVKLGIPPTTDVGNPRWRLPAATNALARTYVDGYMWFGRPWLYRQASPFDVNRALQLARTSPY